MKTLYVTALLVAVKKRNFFFCMEWPFAFDGDHGPMAFLLQLGW